MKLFTEDTFNYTDEASELTIQLSKQFKEIAAKLDNPRELHAIVNNAVTYATSYEIIKRNSKLRLD